MQLRQLFLTNLAQTSDLPLMLEVERAEGSYIYNSSGERYLDLISGISVSNVGHRDPHVINAVQGQLSKYMHVMVYGEYVQAPQVQYAGLLTEHLPAHLNSVYFTNSGTEATEGAMKLAKRITGRREFVAFKDAYHGSTQGALSIAGGENYKQAFRPLLPGTKSLQYNDFQALDLITPKTAAVFIEAIQGEAGAKLPEPGFLKAVREKTSQTGALLVIDEIQSGFGRTGTLWAFEQEGIGPDILLLGKALGGGMPLGAFITSAENMAALKENPVLGHITTFGGHPVSCAAGKAAFEVTLQKNLANEAKRKGDLFREKLRHPAISHISGRGLLLAVHLRDFDHVISTIKKCFEKGILTDWFLFNNTAMRLAPPLTISDEEIEEACTAILGSLGQ